MCGHHAVAFCYSKGGKATLFSTSMLLKGTFNLSFWAGICLIVGYLRKSLTFVLFEIH